MAVFPPSARALGSRETRLLLSLVAATATARASVEEPLPSDVDWRSFLAAARRHRLGALVLEGAEASGRSLPRRVAEALSNDRSRELARTALRLHELDAVAEAAAASRRTIALLKGAWACTALYDHPAARPMADIDILVHPETVASWEATLGELGYEARDAADHATLFAHRSRGVYLELHRSLTSCAAFVGLDTAAVLERSLEAAAYGDPSVRTLAWEDHLVHLALHAAFQHGMRQAAVSAWDAFLLAERPELDLGRFAARADRRPIRAYVYGGLSLADTLFPHPRLRRARESLEAALPGRLARRASRLRPERLLAPSKSAVFGSPVGRFLWVERPADALSLAHEVLRPPSGGGASGYLSRATQLFRNHVVAPLRGSHAPLLRPLSSSTKASLEEVPHV